MMLAVSLLACGGGDTTSPEPEPKAEAVAATDAKPAAVAASADTLETSMGAVGIHPVYHATLYFTVGDQTIWVDPWTKGDLSGPKADLVLITDIHPDHLDKAAIEAVSKPGTTLVAPAAVVAELPAAKPLANGEKTGFAGVSIEAVPMYNLERGPEPGKLFHDPGRGNGYVLTFGDKRVYIAGDTECTPEMKAMANVDVAFVPMILPYTMTPAEAGACVAAFRPGAVYPFHYGDSDLAEFSKLVEPAGVEVRLREWYPGGKPF